MIFSKGHIKPMGAFNTPYFCKYLASKLHTCPCSYPVQIHTSNHTLNNEIAIVSVFGQQPSVQTAKNLQCYIVYKARKPNHAQEERNNLPSANYGLSKAKPRHGHAVCTLQVHPPILPCPTLFANADFISKGHYWRQHHVVETLMMSYEAISG